MLKFANSGCFNAANSRILLILQSEILYIYWYFEPTMNEIVI